ncbi:MAG: acetyl-CoA acetyltransferase, partial [Dehalococcoidia bacterium]|nr:acetyl-CoA acetyltransferase [Dehalococcoidia bacterium]
MAESIKDRVAIIGMGCTKFGENWDKSFDDMLVEAAYEAFGDAGIEPKDVQAAWLGTCFLAMATGMALSVPLRLQYKPVTRVENACATGSDALRNATYAVAAGIYDIALAIGVEKLKDSGFSGLAVSGGVTAGVGPTATAPGMFAMMATTYFSRYGLAPDEGKRMLAHIPVKSHHNGSLNPRAHFQREVSLETVLKAPIIAWPLGLYDCCGNSDGAAAAIIVRAEDAKKFRPDPVYIKALQIATSSGEEMLYDDDWTHVESSVRAARSAYQEAGISNPRQQ